MGSMKSLALAIPFLLLGSTVSAANPDLDKKLAKAVNKRDTEKVQELLREGADPNSKDGDGIPALELALREYEKREKNRGDFMKIFKAEKTFGALLRAGADFKQWGIQWRVLKSYALRTEHFIWMMERSEAKDWRSAFNAADGNKTHGEDSIVEPMLARCVEIYQEGLNCSGALPVAVRRGASGIAEKLLEKGAAVDGPDEYGRTALVFAAQLGDLELAKKLLARGANANPPSKAGFSVVWSPLALAAYSRSRVLAELLLEKGANLDAAIRFAANERKASPTSPWADAAAYLEKLADRGAAAGSATAGLSKEELASVVRSAVAGSQTGAKEAPNALSSDVDSPAYRHPERPDDFAVVVGIEKYSEVPDAPFAARDAEAVKKHLLALGLPSRNVVHLSGYKAGYKAIEKFVEAWLPRNVGENSRVFFYFSGHGPPIPLRANPICCPGTGTRASWRTRATPWRASTKSWGS